MMRGLVSALSILATGWLLSGCNTMEGIGEDVEAAGDELEEAAEETGS